MGINKYNTLFQKPKPFKTTKGFGFHFKLPIYGMGFSYFEDLSTQEYLKFTNGYFKEPLLPLDCYNAYTDYYMGTVAIRFVSEFKQSTLAHEVFHAVTHYMSYMGIKDEEAMAYLLDYLIDVVNEYRNHYLNKK